VAGLNRHPGESPTHTEAGQALAEITGMHREFPAWAIWLPDHGRGWTAVRPASGRAPEPTLPMVWASAESAAELADQMRSIDGQLNNRAC
jgi:hypothetical protein